MTLLTALVILGVILFILTGPLWALTGAWIYHRGTTGSSPLAAPFVRKIAVTGGENEPTANKTVSEYQHL